MKHRHVITAIAILVLATLSCQLLGGSSDEPADVTEKPATAVPPTDVPEEEQEEALAPEVAELVTVVRSPDGMEMVLIPAGDFLMGDDGSPYAPEKPEHLVTLDEYWIDRYEVTNAQYRLCVEAGVCGEPGIWTKKAELSGDAQPALVPWDGAEAYCEWAGGRLPTEAEWEKAIRGTDGRDWPWGNEFVELRANVSGEEDGYVGTAPVGSFPDDVSPYGLFDAAGNAGEWVSDWFDREYYSRSPSRNPTGPASGEQRVHRAPIANGSGGPEKSRCVARYGVDPSWEYGLRCVFTEAPEEGEISRSGEVAVSDEGAAETAAAEADSGEAAESGDDDSSESAASADGDVFLQSYQNITTMREGGPEGEVMADMSAIWDGETESSHIEVGSGGVRVMEEITVGDQRWTKVGTMDWMAETLTPEEQAAWARKMSLAQLWGDASLVEEDLEEALSDDIELVPAQIFPLPIKAAMVYDGEEVVKGVNCKRYSVDTDLDYTRDLPVAGETHYTGHAKGTIWVANQAGIPAIIVRAEMDQVLTTTNADGEEETTHPYWEHMIFGINEPVEIEPPV